ncbi:MAG: hypothetical protein OES38_00725 [Gammaproteobacteria bacterium]|nr:hypothetical protein [Gammaproteobacteria bacterium]
MSNRIKCNSVSYRTGYVEITAGIHDDCVNLETWNIHPEIDLATRDLHDADFPADGVIGNTEIELSANDARRLIRLLEVALEKL